MLFSVDGAQYIRIAQAGMVGDVSPLPIGRTLWPRCDAWMYTHPRCDGYDCSKRTNTTSNQLETDIAEEKSSRWLESMSSRQAKMYTLSGLPDLFVRGCANNAIAVSLILYMWNWMCTYLLTPYVWMILSKSIGWADTNWMSMLDLSNANSLSRGVR